MSEAGPEAGPGAGPGPGVGAPYPLGAAGRELSAPPPLGNPPLNMKGNHALMVPYPPRSLPLSSGSRFPEVGEPLLPGVGPDEPGPELGPSGTG